MITPSPMPATPSDAAPGAAARLAALLQRMDQDSDFPALSAQMLRVQQIASSENESLNRLTNEILKDVALTNKLLRVVNSAEFAHQGGIGTVSRAISLIGFSGIRNLATGLVLLEHMENHAHASQLRHEFLRALFAATLATDLCHTTQEQEQVFLAAMFQNLGRLLAEFYFPQEAQQVRERSAGDLTREQAISRQVLGVDYDTLGSTVAQHWGLPDDIRRIMTRPEGAPPTRALHDPNQRMRWLALAANDLADTVLQHDVEDLPPALKRQARRYHTCLQSTAERVEELTLAVRTKLNRTVEAIGLVIPGSAIAARLLSSAEPTEPTVLPERAPEDVVPDVLDSLDSNTPDPADSPEAPPPSAMDILARGVEDVTLAMVEGVAVNDILRTILETIYRALGAQRVLFGLKEPGTETITGRFGIGHGATQATRAFRAAMNIPDDLFGAICRSGRDTLMRDACAPQISQRLPAWLHQAPQTRTLLLLPLQHKGNTFALLYADKAEADGITLHEREMTLLKTLRNQAVMAMRQGRG